MFFALVYPDSYLEVYSWDLPLKGNPQKNALSGLPTPQLQYAGRVDPDAELPRGLARQCAVTVIRGVPVIAVLRTSSEGDEVVLVRGPDSDARSLRRVTVFERVGKLVAEEARSDVTLQGEGGEAEEPKFLLETLSGEILESAFCGPLPLGHSPVKRLTPPPQSRLRVSRTPHFRPRRSPRCQSFARTSRRFCSRRVSLLRSRSAIRP